MVSVKDTMLEFSFAQNLSQTHFLYGWKKREEKKILEKNSSLKDKFYFLVVFVVKRTCFVFKF
jgi:hypothetical protein